MIDCVLDLSHFQGNVDFQKVKSHGIQAVILKATQGVSHIDPSFSRNMTNAITAGIMVGAYHFGTGDDTQDQITNFMNTAGAVTLKVLDFENNTSGSSMSPQQVSDFVQSTASMKFPMIYADYGHCQRILESSDYALIFEHCPLWIAQYKQESQPRIPTNTWAKWTLWQYTDSGSVPGISGKVDRSYFNGEIADLQSLFL